MSAKQTLSTTIDSKNAGESKLAAIDEKEEPSEPSDGDEDENCDGWVGEHLAVGCTCWRCREHVDQCKTCKLAATDEMEDRGGSCNGWVGEHLAVGCTCWRCREHVDQCKTCKRQQALEMD